MTDGSYTYRSEDFGMYVSVESRCCTPETNITRQLHFKKKIELMPTVKCICQLQPKIEFSINNSEYSPHLVFLVGKNNIDSRKFKKQVFVRGNW